MWFLLLLLQPVFSRPYHLATPTTIVTSRHTHVEVVGRVSLVKREADGDWHIRVTDGKHFIVAEIIPTMTPLMDGPDGPVARPLELPKYNDCVRVRGIRRLDNEAGHGWVEIHPVEELAVIACVP